MEKKENPNGPALTKRAKISKTQQETLLITLIAATVLGVCGVLIVYFIRYINFNNKVIEAKDDAIVGYEKTIKNIGLCKDVGNDGKYSEDEIKKCNPDSIDSSSMYGTLRYNVLVNMAQNTDLESVARSSQSDCYDENGDKINWQDRYDNDESEEERNRDIAMLKMCSALRVIPDALPAQANEEALMSSLNQIFIISNWEPESLSPSGTVIDEGTGISTIPVSLSVEASTNTTMSVLNNIEKSIRTFDLQTANIAWSKNDNLTLKAQGVAYYTSNADIVEENKTVYATDAAKRKRNK